VKLRDKTFWIGVVLYLATFGIIPALAEAAPWTNTAEAPSKLRYRGLSATYSVMHKLPVPKCAVENLARRIAAGKGYVPLYLTNDKVTDVLGREFETTFAMSFRKNGKDYIDHDTTLALLDDATAEIYFHQCDGKVVYVGYAPNCQNVFLLTYKGEVEIRHRFDYEIVYRRECRTVPLPSTALLLVIGLVTVVLLQRSKQHER